MSNKIPMHNGPDHIIGYNQDDVKKRFEDLGAVHPDGVLVYATDGTELFDYLFGLLVYYDDTKGFYHCLVISESYKFLEKRTCDKVEEFHFQQGENTYYCLNDVIYGMFNLESKRERMVSKELAKMTPAEEM